MREQRVQAVDRIAGLNVGFREHYRSWQPAVVGDCLGVGGSEQPGGTVRDRHLPGDVG